MELDLDLGIPGFLYALGGPERIDVYRCKYFEDGDPDGVYEPVAEYIRDHGLVLALRDEHYDRDMVGYTAEYMVYVPPQVRNDVTAGTAISLPWLPGSAAGHATPDGSA